MQDIHDIKAHLHSIHANAQKVFTHDGIFHADEIFGLAIMMRSFPHIDLTRTRNPTAVQLATENPGVIVLDLGGCYDPEFQNFDHHQKEGAGQRSSDVPYSSAGLIWKHYGRNGLEVICQEQVWNALDDGIISAIDAVDCSGLSIYRDAHAPLFTISQAIGSFNQGHPDDFYRAVMFAKAVLENEITTATESAINESYLRHDMEDQCGSPILVMSQYCKNWASILKDTNYQRVVYRDLSGTWRVQVVPETALLPESWAGLNGIEFDRVTHVPDGIFCHRGRFIAGHKFMDGAIQLAHLSIPAHHEEAQV